MEGQILKSLRSIWWDTRGFRYNLKQYGIVKGYKRWRECVANNNYWFDRIAREAQEKRMNDANIK